LRGLFPLLRGIEICLLAIVPGALDGAWWAFIPGLKIQTWATLVLLRTGWGYNGFQRIWQQ
jgi:hypothetical protein